MFSREDYRREKASSIINKLIRWFWSGLHRLRKHDIEIQISFGEAFHPSSAMGPSPAGDLDLVMNAIEVMSPTEPRVLSINPNSTEQQRTSLCRRHREWN